MSIQRLMFRTLTVGIIFLLLPVLSLQAQNDTTVRDPQALAARLLGFDGYAIPEPAPLYQPGDTAQFWVAKDGSDTPVQVTGRLMALTSTLYVWVEDELRYNNTRAMQTMAGQLEQFLAALRRPDLFTGVTTTFPGINDSFVDPGNVLALPDVDNDPHLHILYTINLRDGVAALYNPNNSLPAAIVPGGYSNEREMILLNTSLFADTPLHDPTYSSVAARTYYRMVADYNFPGQASWLTEAMAWFSLLALQEQSFGGENLNAYLNAPDTPFHHATLAVTPVSVVAGQQLFINYLTQRVGFDVLQTMTTQPGEGVAAIDTALAQFGVTDLATGTQVTARDLFADFVIANAINSPMGDGRFVHRATQLEAQQRAAVVAIEDQFQADLPQQTVNQLGTRYFWLTSTTARTFALGFNGQPSATRLPFPPDSDPNNHFYWSGRGDNQDATLTRSFDLTGIRSATLTFDAWYRLAADWNYTYVEVSTDGGATWTILPTEASSRTNPYGVAYGPAYTGVSNPERSRPFPYLGVTLDTNGITITAITDDSPLLDTEIHAGDTIIGYDGHPWPGRPDVIGYLSDFEPGEEVNLYIQRGEERFDAPVVLGIHPTRVFTPEPLWLTQEVDLSSFAGQPVLVRFEYISLPDRENQGFALDNIAIPEIDFLDDAESGVPGWTLNGWQQTNNQIPQQFLVQVATNSGIVRRLIGPSDTATDGGWTFNINPGEGFLIAISGLNDNTDAAAVFDLYLRDLTPAQPEATEAPAANT